MIPLQPVAEFELLQHESINFDLDCPSHPDNLIYHFTRQRRGSHMQISTIDHMGFCAALVTKGRAVSEHLGQTVELHEGSVFLRRQNEPYRFYKTDTNELGLTMIMFDPSITPIWSRLVDEACIAVQLYNSAKVIEFVNTFFDLLSRNPMRRIARANAFAPFFLETVMAENLQALSHVNLDQKQSEKCRHYLHEHFSKIRSMDAVAEACHISRSHLYNLFHEYVQMTPKEYLERLKLNKASDLLTQTNWTMERIAEETGYADAPTFSKAFKRRSGIPPTEWRHNASQFNHFAH